MWKELIVSKFKVEFLYSVGRTEENRINFSAAIPGLQAQILIYYYYYYYYLHNRVHIFCFSSYAEILLASSGLFPEGMTEMQAQVTCYILMHMPCR
jgi:hypothetical protein